MATINTELKEYHFYGKDMVEGIYYRKADVDKLIESLKAVHNIELPDPPKPRRATNRELSRWLAQGNGEVCNEADDSVMTTYSYEYDVDNPQKYDNDEVWDALYVRKWSDTEWHEPTVEYLFGGEK